MSSWGIFILHVQNSHGVVSSGCPQHQDDPRSSSLFMHKKCPSVLHHLWVSSAPRAFPGHLHPSSHASCLPSSCVISWHPWHAVPSRSICMLLHSQPPPSISHQPLILVFSALDALPGHLCRPSHAGQLDLSPSLGVFGTRCPPRTSPSHLPPSYTFWCLWYWLPSWDIFVLLHAQTSFIHPESLFLDVFCPPGASPSSLTCKSPSSLL